jgi:hypothetical protein
MSWGNRLGLIFGLPLLGAVLCFGLANARLTGKLAIWQSLGQPPEPAVALASVGRGLWVTSASGQVYTYEAGGWHIAELPPPETEPQPDQVLPEYCQNPPKPIGAVDVQSDCRHWGPGMRQSSYALLANGTVLLSEQATTEGDSVFFLFSPLVGAVLGLIAVPFVFALRPTSARPAGDTTA